MPFDLSYPGAPSRQKERASTLKKRSEALFRKQDMHKLRWQTVAEIFYPERADFTVERTEGNEMYDGLYTSQPQLLRRQMADRVNTMTRPEGQQWFKREAVPDDLMENDEAKAWCESATKTQRRVIYDARSGFVRAMSESDNDYVAFGNAVMAYGYNEDKSGVLFRTCHLRDCAFAEGSDRLVNELHETMKPTISQAVRLFGKDRLPKKWRDMCEDQTKAGETVRVRRCVVPLDDYMFEGERFPKGVKFLSVYIALDCDDDKEIALREEYFSYFPYHVRRWMTVSGEVYARSPCADLALADANTLNSAEAAALKGIEFTADPAYTAPDDGIIGEVELGAGKVTYVDRELLAAAGTRKVLDKIEAGEPKTALEYIAIKEAKMARAFFMDLLAMPERRGEMTATEFMQRFKAALRDAAPVFQPLIADYSILMEGVGDLILNAHGPADPWGGFEDGPDVLSGAQTEFKFMTALDEAFSDMEREQALEVQNQYLILKEAGAEAVDQIDMDKVVRASIANFKTEWTRPDDEVAALREQRQAAQAAEQAKQEGAAIADMALKAKPEQYRAVKQDMQEMV